MSGYFILGHGKKRIPIEVDIFEWSDFVADLDNTRVDRTEINGFVVSTVFIGRGDMWGNRDTEWFETTVYMDGIKCEEFTTAHETWDEAKLGHSLAINNLK